LSSDYLFHKYDYTESKGGDIVLGELLTGFSIIFTWENLLIILIGTIVGIAIGA
jgi:hypothetical protein